MLNKRRKTETKRHIVFIEQLSNEISTLLISCVKGRRSLKRTGKTKTVIFKRILPVTFV